MCIRDRLYTNYFGIKEKYVERLASRSGGRLVVDLSLIHI